jgi:hypothetical protein
MPDRVVFTGSRRWRDRGTIEARVIRLHRELVLVHGSCPSGADAIVDHYARRHGWTDAEPGLPRPGTIERYPAHWETFGRGAGFRRNDVMLSLPDVVLVIAFRWEGASPGTDHMIAGAERRGLPLEVWTPETREQPMIFAGGQLRLIGRG